MLVGATLAAGLAGCSESASERARNAAELAISPGGGAALPDVPIAVQARRGTIENVTVFTNGTPVQGALSADRTQWRSRWSLDPGREYTVRATAVGKDGKSRTATSSFTTVKAKKKAGVTVDAPYDKETVGVGIPIIVRFDRKVTDRAAVERALEVSSDRPVEGAWHWFEGDEGPEVVFRTRQHWPAHTKVRFQAHLSGVRTGANVYGGKNTTVDFTIGDSHISKVGEDTHKMVVTVNGKKARTILTSMGRGGLRKYTTTNGDHLTMDKSSPEIMDSSTVGCGPGCPGYYRLTVYSAVRISDSGEFVHSAPWSVGDQGHDNVSHGCINVSPSAAKWFYNLSYRGDPIEVTGTSRELEPDNGWGYWQMDWNDWVNGGALKRPVTTGPRADASTLSAQSGNGAQPTGPRAAGGD
ncbi:L,D-transpeptidase [Actinomadura fibrosa]|uniref:Ig-like domain-containing protein n=1 Tax=Actinomadura fibrosa TaxID=111802 RepID=A0ABW2XKI4_9ACTN|nr:Ig-like domain-containing protein [Actinomadura fibrosa]